MTDSPALTYRVGDTFTYTRTFTEADVRAFAALSGDRGIHHMTPDAAGRLMAHGLLTATLPTKLGGDMNYLAREMRFDFERPVFAGDTITCRLVVTRVEEQAQIIQLAAAWSCTNQNSKIVMTGSSSGVIRK
jgi:acyl dehydratase